MEIVRDLINISSDEKEGKEEYTKDIESMSKKELSALITKVTNKMNRAAAELNFEEAAVLRDQLKELKIALRDFDV